MTEKKRSPLTRQLIPEADVARAIDSMIKEIAAGLDSLPDILDEQDAMASGLQDLLADAAVHLKAAASDVDFLGGDQSEVLRYRKMALNLLEKLDDGNND